MIHFIHPFTTIVAGPSGCGKSNFVINFLTYIKDMCDIKFHKIIWCYDEMQPLYNRTDVTYVQGIPDMYVYWETPSINHN